jgi:hypothetical protein
MSSHADAALIETLAFAVPLRIAELRGESPQRRRLIARRAAGIISGQGDTLMFGSSARFGHGAAEMAAHKRHGRVTDASRDELTRTCPVCKRGQATYSAGEVFNELAKGLACAAYQPGGVSFAGLCWCAAHPRARWGRYESCPGCLADEAAAKERAS